jgi:hypothetical protein
LKGRREIFIALVLLAVAGCARIHVHRTSTATPPSDEKARHFVHQALVFGLINASVASDLSLECPGGWRRASSEVRPLQGLFHLLTLNLYAPWDVQIACQ